jgi:hypothetical protein
MRFTIEMDWDLRSYYTRKAENEKLETSELFRPFGVFITTSLQSESSSAKTSAALSGAAWAGVSA